MTGFATRQDFSLRRMGSRMLQAARFNGDTFRELRDDPSTTVQSVSLVAIIGLCYGAGPGLFGYFNGDFSALWTSVVVILTVLLASISIAIVWSGITWSPGPLFLFTLTPNPVVSDITRAVGSVWIVVA